jgi:hypothetical protein
MQDGESRAPSKSSGRGGPLALISGPFVAVHLVTPGRFNDALLDRRAEGEREGAFDLHLLFARYEVPAGDTREHRVDPELRGLLRSTFQANAGEECDRW